MSEPFLGEIKMFAGNFAPKGFSFANGQILTIAQNTALFSLYGITYGGNGQTTFALPNLQGRTPMHWGSGAGLPPVALGQAGGQESHTLTGQETAAHTHVLSAAAAPAANAPGPGGNLLGTSTQNQYVGGTPTTTLAPETVSNVGGGQPHPNLQPYLVLNVCICIAGIFPSRS